MRLRLVVLVVGLALLGGALAAAAVQVVLLERGELEHVSPWRSLASLASAPGSTRISARLTEVELAASESALFELCAGQPMRGPTWTDVLTVVAWIPARQKLELKIPLDA